MLGRQSCKMPEIHADFAGLVLILLVSWIAEVR